MFKNKTVVITGSTGGIGNKTSEMFARNNAKLILFAKNKKKLLSQKKRLQKLNKNLINIYSFDLSSYEEIKKVFRDINKKFKKIDILINNAGILRDSNIGMITQNDIYETLRVNLIAPIILTQLFSKIMSKNSSIVNVSSIVGKTGNISQSVYAASKAGLIGLTLSASKELANRKVRVNAIAPGFINTKMISSVPKSKKKEILSNIKLGRIGTASEVALAIKFLSSSDSNYITGQVLGVDGGMLV